MSDPVGVPTDASEGIEAAIGRAVEVLAAASTVAMACHVNPDPDALGSMMGLAQYLRGRGVEVVCSWGNQPFEHPRWASLFGDVSFVVPPADFPKEPEVMVALDTAAVERLGVLAANAARAREVVVLDHHRTNPGFGTVVVIDPRASSTAELAFRVMRRIGDPIPDQAAASLYAGLLTDTGRFQYEATTPETLRVAAELREFRFDHARMGQTLFEDNSFRYLRVLSVALARAELVPDADLVWTYLLQSDLAEHAVAPPETDDLIDVLRTAREADVACVLKQQRDGRFRVSLRSRGGTDVGAVAQRFGGGGHRLAAGYTSPTGLEATLAAVVGALGRTRTDATRADATRA